MSTPWIRCMSNIDAIDCPEDIELLSDTLEHLFVDARNASETIKCSQVSYSPSLSDSRQSSASYGSEIPLPVETNGDILLARGPPTGIARYPIEYNDCSSFLPSAPVIDRVGGKRASEHRNSFEFIDNWAQARKFHCPGYEYNNNNYNNNNYNRSNDYNVGITNNNNAYGNAVSPTAAQFSPAENSRSPYDQNLVNGHSSSRLMTGGSVLVRQESDVETDSGQEFVQNDNREQTGFLPLIAEPATQEDIETLLIDTVTSLPLLDPEEPDFLAVLNDANSPQEVALSDIFGGEVEDCDFWETDSGAQRKGWKDECRTDGVTEPTLNQQILNNQRMTHQFPNQYYEPEQIVDGFSSYEDHSFVNSLMSMNECSEFVSRPSCGQAFSNMPRNFMQTDVLAGQDFDRILPPSTGPMPGSYSYANSHGECLDYGLVGQKMAKENPINIVRKPAKREKVLDRSPDSGYMTPSPQETSCSAWPDNHSQQLMTPSSVLTIDSSEEDEFPASLLTPVLSREGMTAGHQPLPHPVGLDRMNFNQGPHGNLISTMQRPRSDSLPTTVSIQERQKRRLTSSKVNAVKPLRTIACKGTSNDEVCGYRTVTYPAFFNGVINLETLHAACTPSSFATPATESICTPRDRRAAAGLTVQKIISPDEDGDTLLHIGIAQGKIGFTEALLDRCDRDGITAQVVNSVNHPQTPLSLAVAQNQTQIVSLLMKHGADINQQFLFRRSRAGPVYYMPLHSAAARGQDWEATLCQLLRSGSIDINAFNTEGRTALHIAMEVHGTAPEDGRVQTEQALTDAVGAAFRAIEGGQCDQPKIDSRLTIYHLARHGADLTVCDGLSGRTPLHYAVERKDPEFLDWFLKLAFFMNSMPWAGPQSVAAGKARPSLSEIVNKRTAGNVSALHLAAGQVIAAEAHVTSDQVRIVELLLMSGAELSQNGDSDLKRWLKKIPQIAHLMPKSTGSSAPRVPTSARRNSAKCLAEVAVG